jgi:hypothetical protein
MAVSRLCIRQVSGADKISVPSRRFVDELADKQFKMDEGPCRVEAGLPEAADVLSRTIM